MHCSQFDVDCWSHLWCRRALHQDKPRDVNIDHGVQRRRCDWASRGRGERDKMEAERECREIIQGTPFQNWIVSNGFIENNESSWKDSTWYWILTRGFVHDLKSSQHCLCFQAEVLPAIKAYEPRITDLVKAPMSRFHAKWEAWLANLQGCLFPRETNPDTTATWNLTTLALGLSQSAWQTWEFIVFEKNLQLYWQADKTLLFEFTYEDFRQRRLLSPANAYCLFKDIPPEAFRLSASLHKDHGAEVCVRRRRRKSRQWWTWMRLRTINWIWKHTNNLD